MASLFKRVEARMMDPKINLSFNNEVGRKHKTTEESRRNYALADEAFQEYKKNDPSWKQHFE